MDITTESNLKKHFAKDGYVVIDTHIDSALLDQVVAAVSPYFGGNRVEPEGVTYADQGRVQDAWLLNPAISAVANSRRIRRVLYELYGAHARPFQTLNFGQGTQQATHSDSIHFNSEPFGMMCGVWVALEDVGSDQGPLRLYSGSNALPEMNYSDFGLKADQTEYPNYLNSLERLIDQHQFKEVRATVRKGQAIIWAANTLHGGAPQINQNLTRYSQVTHYYMGKPKAWKPSLSSQQRAYFKPDRVRDIYGWRHRVHCYKLTLKKLLLSRAG